MINYIILAGEQKPITPLSVPDNMHHEVLRWLAGMPHSVVHYLGGSNVYEGVVNVGGISGLKVTWLYDNSYDDVFSERFKEFHPGLKVFVVAVSTAKENNQVNKFLQGLDDDGFSVALSLNPETKANIPVAKNRDQLLDFIDSYVRGKFPDLYSKKRAPHPLCESLDRGFLFNPTVPNTQILHAASGDFKFEVTYYSQEDKSKESSDAIKEANTFNRQNQLISQLKSFDRLDEELFTTQDIAPWMTEQRKSPLIILMPFNTKDVVSLFDGKVEDKDKAIQKSFKNALSQGQTRNYTNKPAIDVAVTPLHVTAAVQTLLSPRSRYLDILGGLHSSLRFSPILRLPAVGSSFNNLLSRVAPVASERLVAPDKKQSLIKTISKIGQELTDRELSEDARMYIQKSERQIVAVTDLPIEWMNINGVPLAFSHDVCRLPEVPYAIAMQHYVIDRHACFSIPKDILNRTLVVFGCSDSQFLLFQNSVEEREKELGYKTIRPKNVKELAESVNSLKPMLLIFDTHGGYDGGSHESSVQIGEDYLSPDEVMRLNISAPLIFMSACTTAPLYNLTKTIVNSFIAAGAVAVTASYMPLSINEASVTYMRLLYQLKFASTECIHKNWLSFISYVLRTSAVHESFLDMAHPDKSDNATHDIHTDTIIEAFQFKRRKAVFDRLKKGITVDNKKISFDKHVPNYLMYTTVGRADLIDFEVSRDAIYKALGISNPE